MKHNQHILLAPSDYPLIASPTLAKAYGVAAATFLQKLHYCLEKVMLKSTKEKSIGFIAMSNGNKPSGSIVSPQSNGSSLN